MYGGGQGAGWTMGGPLVPGLASDAMVRQTYDACLGASRPGQIAFSQGGGLPGMSGMQRGGAYTTSLEGPIAGLAEYNRDATHCLPNHSNPMNNGSIQRGGGTSISVAASASPILEQHTARYTTAPSQWTGSTGAPVLLNQPLNGQAWSKACTQTGGRRRGRGRKNRKSRRRQCGGELSKGYRVCLERCENIRDEATRMNCIKDCKAIYENSVNAGPGPSPGPSPGGGLIPDIPKPKISRLSPYAAPFVPGGN